MLAAIGTCLTAVLALSTPVPASTQWALDPQHFDASALWKGSQGDGVTVAVVDTGVTPVGGLAGALDTGGDVVTGGTDTSDRAADSHGTTVATIIAARDLGSGALGLAPMARILPVRVSTTAGPVDPVLLAQGIAFATAQGAKVINLSFGTSFQNPELAAAVRQAEAADVVVVAAAGNGGTTGNAPQYPAALPGVLAVTGLNRDGSLWTPGQTGKYVAVAAPAADISAVSAGGQPVTVSGTTYACAWASAAVALVRSRYPHESAAQVIARLTSTSRRVAGTTPDEIRYGAIDPGAALAAPEPEMAENPLLDARTSAPSAAPQTVVTSKATWSSLPALFGAGALVAAFAVGLAIAFMRRRRRIGRAVARSTPQTRRLPNKATSRRSAGKPRDVRRRK